MTVVLRTTLLLSLLSLTGCEACNKLLHRGGDAGMDGGEVAVVDAGAMPDMADAAVAEVDAGAAVATAHTAMPVAPKPGDAGVAIVDAGAPMADAGGAVAKTDSPVGTWVGTLTEHGATYPVTIVMASEAAGTIAYGAPYTCKGTLTMQSKNEPNKTWHYKGKITDQGTGRKCATSENDNLSVDKAGVWTFSAAGGSARGIVTRK